MSNKNTNIAFINNHPVFYSYATPLAAVFEDVVYINKQKYSRTSTRQLNEFLETVKGYKLVEVEPKWFAEQGFNILEGSRIR